MFKEVDVIAFFEDQGIEVPGFAGTIPDAAPDRAYSVSISGGLGLQMEDLEDRPTISVVSRGPSAIDTPEAGSVVEDDALAIDRIWIDSSPMTMLGDFQVKGKGRFGGPPSFVAVDDRRRTVRAAIYWCRIVRQRAGL